MFNLVGVLYALKMELACMRPKGENVNMQNSLTVDNVAFAFTTGEIWSIDTDWLSSANANPVHRGILRAAS